MAKSEETIKTEIKYELTSCYYCSEFLDNDNFKVTNVEFKNENEHHSIFFVSNYIEKMF